MNYVVRIVWLKYSTVEILENGAGELAGIG